MGRLVFVRRRRRRRRPSLILLRVSCATAAAAAAALCFVVSALAPLPPSTAMATTHGYHDHRREHLAQDSSWYTDDDSGAVRQHNHFDPEAALRWGHHILRQFGKEHRAKALAEFDTLASDSGFPTGQTLYLLGRAHDEGREDIGIRRDEAAAREIYETAAKLGHPASQHALAAVLAASAVAGEQVEAILYDLFASLGGDPLAHAALGYRYLHGISTIQNCAQSMKHYEVAARETMRDLYSDLRGGVSRSVDRTRLADRFVVGRRPVEGEDADTAHYFKSAAEAGDMLSQRSIAIFHYHGSRGVAQDLSLSLSWFKKAASADSLSAAMAGDMLMRGAGAEPDYDAAYAYFLQSQQESISLNGLGYMYYHGLGVEQDVVTAYQFFEQVHKSEKDTNADINYNMAMMFKGDRLVDPAGNHLEFVVTDSNENKVLLKKDMAKAYTLLEAAATLGHVQASFQLAQLYGESEPLALPKCKSAVSHLKKITERGPWTQDMREAHNRVVAGDYGGALLLYSRLAEIGMEVAQSNVAWLLDSGHCGAGGDVAPAIGSSSGKSNSNSTAEVVCQKRALRMYEHAAKQGRAAAEVKVGDYLYYGKAGLAVDYKKAAIHYLKASNAKHAEGLFSMGFMYQTGRGVAQDLFLAKRYFDEVALSSVEAIPVARLSLLLLRAHSSWIRWREWWHGLVGERHEVASSKSDRKKTSKNNTFSAGEVVLLMSLVALLIIIVRKRAQRERQRRLAE